MQVEAARCFGALKKAIDSLEMNPEHDLDPASDPRFPYPFEYLDSSDDTPRRFKFETQVPGKLVFFGSTGDNKKICIKFTRTYSKVVHEKCAALGRAPTLRGFQRLAGDWCMVVMDHLTDSWRLLSHCLPVHQPFEQIRELLDTLHQHHLVHGDIRGSNILVGKDTGDFMLLDFDWAGTIGETTYPMNLNMSHGLRRPDGVVDGMPILAEHDVEMLNFIIEDAQAHTQ
jgi:hypothetical protein